MFTNSDLLAIKAELTNDPADLGLTTSPSDDEANANKLNAISNTINVKRRALATRAIFSAINPLEHQALTEQQARWIEALLTVGQIDPLEDTEIVDGLNQMFAADSTSRPAYTALLTEHGSRINQLFQNGTLSVNQFITPSDVANARNAS